MKWTKGGKSRGIESGEEEEQMNRLNGQTKLQEERQQLKWERATKHAQQQQAALLAAVEVAAAPQREREGERESARERETWHVLLTQWKWIKRISGQSDCVGIAIDVAAAIGSSFGLMARQLGLVHISTPPISLLLPSLYALTSETTNRGQTGTRWSFFASLLFSVFRFLFSAFVLLIELTGNWASIQIQIRVCLCVCHMQLGVVAKLKLNGNKLIDLSALKISHELRETRKSETFAVILLRICWFMMRCIKRSGKLAKSIFRSFESSLNLVCIDLLTSRSLQATNFINW